MSAAELKQRGNAAFSEGNFNEAISLFSEAIALEPVNEVLYCNRSMAHASLENWEQSVADAKNAVQLQPKYEKAYFRLVKALIQLEKFKEARIYLTVGFNECGDSKHLKSLEGMVIEKTGIPIRPKPTDFDVLEELGDGNFSKIVKAKYKPTQQVYAIKTIEKQTIDRMKRRHPNINNEILIEKRTLNKLDHPNVVLLYATFQDFGTLYYQMEYLSGGEVWSLIQDTAKGSRASVGCPLSLARFYMAEAINALEYMHRRGIVHRDVKPENMLIAPNGRMKFVDFGTCKDLIQKDLNGQEFVGTAEYMSPEVVVNEDSGPETDLWSLGVVFYQLLAGYTAFLAASPYLTFLRIKRSFIRLPCFSSHSSKQLLMTLIQKKTKKRFQAAASMISREGENGGSSKTELSYDKLRQMDFFKEDNFKFPDPFNTAGDDIMKVPKLSEIALRAVGSACHVVADKVALNGGSKVGLEDWVQKFNLSRLKPDTRYELMHYLNRRQDLHGPALYRLFWGSLVDARSIRTDWTEWGYFGFDRHTQGHFTDPFCFVHFSNPVFGYANSAGLSASKDDSSIPKWDDEMKNLRSAISSVNKLRPRFVVASGNFVSSHRSEESDAVGGVDDHTMQTEAVRKCFARISETIPVLFVPGSNDVGVKPDVASIARYHSLYGADFFGFWYGGIRVLVINTTVMLHPENVPDHAALQDTWFEEELEQSKLCAMQIVVFSHHMWFREHAEEDDEQDGEDRYMSKSIRDKWLPMMRHEKVKFIFCGNTADCRGNGGSFRPYLKTSSTNDEEEKTEAVAEVEVTTEDVQVDLSTTVAATVAVEAASSSADGEHAQKDWKDLPDDMPEYSDTDSDEEDREGEDGVKTKPSKDGKDDLFAPDLNYNGPVQVVVSSVGLSSLVPADESDNSEARKCVCVVEVVNEEEMRYTSYALGTVPARIDFSL